MVVQGDRAVSWLDVGVRVFAFVGIPTGVASYFGFGLPVFILSAIIQMFTGGTREKWGGEVSAWSLFNRDGRVLPGTLNAAHIDSEIRHGAMGANQLPDGGTTGSSGSSGSSGSLGFSGGAGGYSTGESAGAAQQRHAAAATGGGGGSGGSGAAAAASGPALDQRRSRQREAALRRMGENNAG